MAKVIVLSYDRAQEQPDGSIKLIAQYIVQGLPPGANPGQVEAEAVILPTATARNVESSIVASLISNVTQRFGITPVATDFILPSWIRGS